MKKFKGLLVSLVVTIVIGGVAWYILLPSLNVFDVESRAYLFALSVIFIASNLAFSKWKEKGKLISKKTTLLWALPLILLIVFNVANISSYRLFSSKKYAKMININEGNFSEDIKEIPFESIPIVDRQTAIKLGDRKMGEMVDLASQFDVSEEYIQIDFQDKAVRVTPLEYNGIFKWFNNKKEGIPGYITVDMDTGSTKLVRLEENIRYSKSDKFGRDITRHIRKNYPTKIIRKISFEIDEEGNPFWIAPTYKPTIGVMGGLDVDSVILVNAVTGEHEIYSVKDTPKWIDRVYDADRIIQQIDYWGSYQSGYWNARFSQQGVLLTTEGYNYLAIDDDVYLYSGITSASGDSSNIGFVLSNLRTKETKLYKISSADEFSAMESAEGKVQEKGYTSTFPILLNINGDPIYFMALKDEASLIKAYAFVDAQDYQKVGEGSTIEKAMTDFGIESKEEEGQEEVEIELTNIQIRDVVISGNTYYLIKSGEEIYQGKGTVDNRLSFLENGSNIKVKYYVNKKGEKVIKELL